MDTTQQTMLILEAFGELEPTNSLELILAGQSDEVNETIACLDSIVEQGLEFNDERMVSVPFWTGNDFHAVLDWFQREVAHYRKDDEDATARHAEEVAGIGG